MEVQIKRPSLNIYICKTRERRAKTTRKKKNGTGIEKEGGEEYSNEIKCWLWVTIEKVVDATEPTIIEIDIFQYIRIQMMSK